MIYSLEKDILQRDPSIQWSDVAGLNDAKAILQEAVVLPVIMPEFFKGIRRPWKVRWTFHMIRSIDIFYKLFRLGYLNGGTTRNRKNNVSESSGYWLVT